MVNSSAGCNGCPSAKPDSNNNCAALLKAANDGNSAVPEFTKVILLGV